jgi:hypothetical protein
MKHLKTIESMFNRITDEDDIKKYIIIPYDNKKYSILEVVKKNWSIVDTYIICYYFYKNSNRLVKCKDEENRYVTPRVDIIKNMIFQSDDLKEVKTKISVIINAKKYNI